MWHQSEVVKAIISALENLTKKTQSESKIKLFPRQQPQLKELDEEYQMFQFYVKKSNDKKNLLPKAIENKSISLMRQKILNKSMVYLLQN